MIIQRATIFGFGKWVNETFDFSSRAVHYIYGENESGKSTLHTFILFMLFGLPPKQCELYRPKTSGQFGGRLHVSLHGDMCMIERLYKGRHSEAVIYTSDGDEKGEVWLQDKLKGMTLATYQSIYSFSAKDLMGISDMQADDLGEIILGIGLTGVKNLYTVEKRLDQQLGSLFKPSGKNPLINQQLTKLQEIQTKANDWKRIELTYQEKQKHIKELEQSLRDIKHSISDQYEERFSIEKQRHALPTIQAFQSIHKQLKQMPERICFPEAGIERWEQLKEKLLPLKSKQAVLEANQSRYHNKIKLLDETLLPVDLNDDGKKMMEEMGRYEQFQDQIDNLSQSLQKQQQQFNTICNDLQLPINREEVSKLELSIFTEKNWKKIKEDLDQLDAKQLQLQLEKQQLAKHRQKLMEEKQAIQERMAKEHQLKQWKAQLQQAQTSDSSLSMDQQKRNAANWQQEKQRKQKQTRSFFLSGIIVAFVLAFVGSVTDYNKLLFVAPFVVVLAFFQWKMRAQSIKEMDRWFTAWTSELHYSITDDERVRLEQSVAQELQFRTKLDAMEEQLKSVDVKALQQEEQQLQLSEQMRRMDERILAEQRIYPFLAQLAPQYWIDVFHSLKQLQFIHKRMEEDETIYNKQAQHMQTIHTKLSAFIERINGEWLEQTVQTQFQYVEDSLTKNEAHLNQRSYYENQLAENEWALQQIYEQMKPLELEMNHLLKAALVESEEVYYEKGKQKQRLQSLKKQEEELVAQLDFLFPKEKWQALLHKTPSVFELEQEEKKVHQIITELEAHVDEQQQKLAKFHTEVDILEKKEDYSTLIHQKEMEQEALHQQARHWATLKAAKEMLLQAKRSYQSKYISKVMEKTSLYFRELTAENYRCVYPPTVGRLFTVEKEDGTRLNVKELSQGTMDQLYIALRFAVSVSMSEEHALPFILDDAFVHFDSVRTKRVAMLLERIAQEQQVIVFTCKQDLIEVAKKRSFVQMLNSIRIH
ncbi:ATP-binding protein [Virgibacillus dokdonensis]|uniref:YhaN AAA domain-containing protein n=1 Tax=Virgibacillus dokdonensis TaxID=302167 RepID=A0A2K9J1A4_9BACI|nr:AAA family ATPase [Virgibacillus dokdonensis]AUJ25709.1 hypothetical protein A21D_02663 [Virgibacillus dokdonensis]